MKTLKTIIMLLAIGLIFFVALFLGSVNTQEIEFNYIIAKSTMRMYTLLAIVFGSGFMIAWIFSSAVYIKLKLKIFRLSNQIKKRNKELEKLQETLQQANE